MPHALKHSISRLLNIISFIFPKRREPDFQEKINNVLIVNIGLLGDVILITSLIKHVRKSFPESKIYVIVPPWSTKVLLYNPDIDKIITYEAFWADTDHLHKFKFRHIVSTLIFLSIIRNIRFDIIINSWFADQPLTAFLLRLMKSRFTIGFDFPYSGKFYDKNLPYKSKTHIINNLLSIARWLIHGTERLDESISNYYLYLPVKKQGYSYTKYPITEQKYIVISPFSSEKSREWRIDNWIILIDYLKNKFSDIDIIITGTKKSLIQSFELVDKSNYPVINLVGKQSFFEFVELISKALVVITIDSSSSHVASAFNIPVVVLYGRQYDNFNQIRPLSDRNKIMVVRNIPCAGCIYGCDNPICMNHSPKLVFDNVCKLLSEI